jgi:3',5'-cyclic AMP phosphodiesterase CpdA
LLHKYDAGTRTIGEKVSTLSLGPTNFFEFSSLSAGHYAIKIHTTLASHVYHFDTSEHVIELSSNQHVDLPFVVSTRGEDIHEVNNVPTLLFLLGVTLVLCFIYREQLLHFWRSSAFGMRNTQQENNENTWIPKSQQKKQNKGR